MAETDVRFGRLFKPRRDCGRVGTINYYVLGQEDAFGCYFFQEQPELEVAPIHRDAAVS